MKLDIIKNEKLSKEKQEEIHRVYLLIIDCLEINNIDVSVAFTAIMNLAVSACGCRANVETAISALRILAEKAYPDEATD